MMLDWLHKNKMEALGYLCMLAAFLNYGTTVATYTVGGILCWGIQELLDQMRGDSDE